MDIKALKDLVKKKGYGTALYENVNGEPVYLSRGIRETILGTDDTQKMIESIQKFQNGDYGTAAEHGKKSAPNHEYGRYEFGPVTAEDDEDTAVWMHRAEDSILVYYKFER